MIITLNDNGNCKQLNLPMFGKDVISFGRNPECDIVIDEEYVSRLHGCFFYENGQWYIQDLGSSFGIFINNQRVERYNLSVGDVICIFSPGKEYNNVQITVNAIINQEDHNCANDFDEVNTVRYTENYSYNQPTPFIAESNVIKTEPEKKVNNDTKNGNNNAKKSKALIIGLSTAVALLLVIGTVFLVRSIGSDKKKSKVDKENYEEATEVEASEDGAQITTEQAVTEENIVHTTTEEEVVLPDVEYRAHVQDYGWKDWSKNGDVSGTTGESKRIEAIDIKLSDTKYKGDIEYTTYVQGFGWQGNLDDSSTWNRNGETCGTTEQSKRVEAICIKLTGELEEKLDIYYRVHVQSYGWMAWAKNGEASGTTGYAKRVEGIQILLVEKGEEGPTSSYGELESIDIVYDEKPEGYEEKIYEPLINELQQLASTGDYEYLHSNMEEHTEEISFKTHIGFYGRDTSFGYCLYDIDNNGIKELIVCSTASSDALGIYSISDGIPVGLCFGWERKFNWIMADGMILSRGSNGAASGQQEVLEIVDGSVNRRVGFLYENDNVYYIKDGDNRDWSQLYYDNYSGCEMVSYDYMNTFMSEYDDAESLDIEVNLFMQ